MERLRRATASWYQRWSVPFSVAFAIVGVIVQSYWVFTYYNSYSFEAGVASGLAMVALTRLCCAWIESMNRWSALVSVLYGTLEALLLLRVRGTDQIKVVFFMLAIGDLALLAVLMAIHFGLRLHSRSKKVSEQRSHLDA